MLHPSIEDVRVEAILHALSDPVRVCIFTSVTEADSPPSCSAFAVVNDKPIPKSSLSQHFKILREAGLIRSDRVGIEVRNTPRCSEIDARFPGLLRAILDAHAVEARGRKA